MFSTKQTQPSDGMFGNIIFSIEKCPTLGDVAMGERCKDNSFYIVRDDLLHPLVNGNKPRKLDALLPIIEDCSGTDVVSCCSPLLTSAAIALVSGKLKQAAISWLKTLLCFLPISFLNV